MIPLKNITSVISKVILHAALRQARDRLARKLVDIRKVRMM
jgi:hypothetical protein